MKKIWIPALCGLFIGVSLYSGTLPAPAVQDVSVSIKEIEPFVYCSVTHKGPYSLMAEAMNQLIMQMQQQNISPAGPPFSIYHNSPEDTPPAQLEWELGFPIPAQLTPQPPLKRGRWEYTKAAAAVHTGPYEESGDTILEIFEWIENNGYMPAGPILARYLNMPGATPDSQLKTEIWIPVE